MTLESTRRRALVQIGALGLCGLSLPRVLQAAVEQPRNVPRVQSVILVYLDGGPSHIDLFDMRPQATAEVRGPFRPMATSVPGTQVCEHLPGMAAQMHRILQVRSVRHEETVHDPAVYQMLTGYKHLSSAGDLKVEPTDHPHMAAAFSQADGVPVVMPRAMQTPDLMRMGGRLLPGQNGGILSPAFQPILVPVSRDGHVQPPNFRGAEQLTRERLMGRTRLVEQFNAELAELERVGQSGRLDSFRQQALDIVSSPHAQRAFDLDLEPAATRERYGRHRHGQAVLLARRLVEAGTRFVTVYWGNEEQDWADGRGKQLANNPWDTHRNHFPLTKESLCPRADQTLSALIEDLAQRGLLESTLVVWMGDFGRTPTISKPWASRDHWPHAFTILLAGGGTRGGEVYGRTDKQAAEVVDKPVSPADITATLFAALGVDPASAIATAAGKLHRLSSGKVVSEWFGRPLGS
ncbi:MAG: DUF1501 domain-containing protein [Pirellulaceae bacterium]